MQIIFFLFLQMDRQWMYPKNRANTKYLTGVKGFLDAAKQDMVHRNDQSISCPCVDCKNGTSYRTTTPIQKHLITRGFMLGYKCWIHHGEQEIVVGDADNQENVEMYDVEPTEQDFGMTTTILPSTNFGHDHHESEDETAPPENDELNQMLQNYEQEYKNPKQKNKFIDRKSVV